MDGWSQLVEEDHIGSHQIGSRGGWKGSLGRKVDSMSTALSLDRPPLGTFERREVAEESGFVIDLMC
jgi:hypothetical protein